MDKTQFNPQDPNALFSPDQWLNQFSNFNNAALPWPSSYAGAPTDAMGKPIQSFVDATNAAQQQYQQQLAAYNSQQQTPGTTLNSPPQGLASVQNNPNPGTPQNLSDIMSNYGQGDPYGAQGSQMAGLNALMGGVGGPGRYGDQYMNQVGANYQQSMQPRQQAAPAAPTPPNNWQAMLTGLANPGKVTTPGATVPASASAQPGPANLQSFLANWKPAQSGPGSGFQQNFATALKGMGY